MAKKDEAAKNFAGANEAGQITTDLLDTFQTLKSNRYVLESRWKDLYDQWVIDPDSQEDGRNYAGRANLRLPQIRKEVETMTRRILKGLFADEYIKATPGLTENEQEAITNSLIVRHFFDKVMNAKQRLRPHVRQTVLLGTGPLRTYWKKEVNKQLWRKRDFVVETKAGEAGILKPVYKTVYKEVIRYNAPVLEPLDLFRTYVYPETALLPCDVQGAFYETIISLDELKSGAKEGTFVLPANFEELGETKMPDHQKTLERMASFGMSNQVKLPPGKKLYKLVEYWGDLDLPGLGVVPAVWACINDNICVRLQQNPYWHQSIPIDFSRFHHGLPGVFYGHGIGEPSIPVQHQLNDTLNQTMDSVTLNLNPITAINPSFAPNADSFEVEPGAQWMCDPEAVKMFTFPDVSQGGMRNVQMLREIISQMSDNQPQLPDPIAGKARSTGQAELAISEWQTDLYNFLEDFSLSLNPMVKKVHLLLQQYLPDEEVLRISGRHAEMWVNKIVSPEDIFGDFNFSWMGSLQIQNQSVKTQQMLSLIKILMTVPPGQGVGIKWPKYIMRLMRDGFQIRDPESLVQFDDVDTTVPPALENKLIQLGSNVEVQLGDDDELHIAQHEILAQDEKAGAYYRALAQRHIEMHRKQMEKKQAQIAMMQQQMAMMQQSAGQGSGPDNPMGNQSQMSESPMAGDMTKGIRG